MFAWASLHGVTMSCWKCCLLSKPTPTNKVSLQYHSISWISQFLKNHLPKSRGSRSAPIVRSLLKRTPDLLLIYQPVFRSELLFSCLLESGVIFTFKHLAQDEPKLRQSK